MIYLDHGATTLPRAPGVREAMVEALETCANPGRGGHSAAMAAADQVYGCREEAGALFSCEPEQVVMTLNCTHGLNIAIRSLVNRGDRVVVSGFEHNAVMRPLHALGARIVIAGRKLFDWADTLLEFKKALTPDTKAAVVTCTSNVFGYILPFRQIADLCRNRGIPLILDGAQAAGMTEINFRETNAAFLAMPGHKGLLGPQGTGLLLCREPGKPLLYGGTGSLSRDMTMPDFLPDTQEAGTLNVPGIAGLRAALGFVRNQGPGNTGKREQALGKMLFEGLKDLKMEAFGGNHQGGTVSFLPGTDCELAAQILSDQGFALRAGLHCAPLAHESAGTIETGTLRASCGWNTKIEEIEAFLQAVSKLLPRVF